MKRFLFILTSLLILNGCGASPNPWRQPAPEAQTGPRSLVSDLFSRPASPADQAGPAGINGADPIPPQRWPGAATEEVNGEAPFPAQGGFGIMTGDQIAAGSGLQAFMPPAIPQVKVALLAPLSGPHKDLGEALLRASQMALFDMGYDGFQLLPRDTQGTPQGAKQAAEDAVRSGAQLILGPLFAESAKAAGYIARRHNINMLSFSTDWSLAGNNTFIMGFLPFSQVQRIADYAAGQGIRDIGILAPNTEYGNTVISAFNALAYQLGLNTSDSLRLTPGAPDTSTRIRQFTRYDSRQAAKEEAKKRAESQTASLAVRGEVTALEKQMRPPFEAILMPVGGEEARSIASLLSYYDLGPKSVQKLGTGLWDDLRLAAEPALEGAWFAAPSPQLRQDFERRYKTLYGSNPPRLATLAYDATALAAVLARTGYERHGKPAFDHAYLTSPNGFSGLDGVFRFRADGIVERGLAVLEFSNGRIVIRDPAPKTFERWIAQ